LPQRWIILELVISIARTVSSVRILQFSTLP
jgi:hypothetical protein